MKRDSNKYIKEIKKSVLNYYKERLVSLIIFGSFSRSTYTPESDIDLLLIVDRLPKRKMKRIEEFIDNVEVKIKNIPHYISPIIKTPEEISYGSPILFDMVTDSIIVYDKNDFFQRIIENLKIRFKELGSKKVLKGTKWYWILKPDLKLGEIIEI
jgi:predicted nucleotidyltransferase